MGWWIGALGCALGLCVGWSSLRMYRILGRFTEAEDVGDVVVRGHGRFRNSSDEPWHDGWGITYAGEAGEMMAVAHSAWLVAGLLLAVVLRGRWRLVGIAVLAGWFALWGGNAFYLSLVRSMDPWMMIPEMVGLAVSSALVVLLGLRLRAG